MNSQTFNSIPEWARTVSQPIPAGHWDKQPLHDPTEASAVLTWKSRFGTIRLPPGMFRFPDGPYTATPHTDVACPYRPRAASEDTTTEARQEHAVVHAVPSPRTIRSSRIRMYLYAHWIRATPALACETEMVPPPPWQPCLARRRWIDGIWQKFQASFPEFLIPPLDIEFHVLLVVWQVVQQPRNHYNDSDIMHTSSQPLTEWEKAHVRTRVFMGDTDRVHVSVANVDDNARFEAKDQQIVDEIYASHPTIWTYGSHRLTWNIAEDNELEHQ